MRVIDISQPVDEGVAVWPGDRPYELSWTMARSAGAAVNVAALRLSAHTGTHADGALHVTDGGDPAGAAPLERYLGPAEVIDARGVDALRPGAVADVDLGAAPRVLFRTRETVDAGAFPERVTHVSPALARRLVAAGIKLLGTDAPSVDPLDSKTLESHRILVDGGVAIVEGLVLSHVRPGRYIFVGLPLRLLDADSTPIRAALVEGLEWTAA